MDGVAEYWIRWWFAAGEEVQPLWCAEPVGNHEGLALCAPISRHELIAHSRAVQLPQPPEPHEGLVRWVRLPEAEQAIALCLVEAICAPQQSLPESLVAHEVWCRSVAKALRPGLWLPSAPLDARLLLGAWIGPQRWMRAKQQWPSSTLSQLPQGLPSNRLDALWSSVLWRASRGGMHAGQA